MAAASECPGPNAQDRRGIDPFFVFVEPVTALGGIVAVEAEVGNVDLQVRDDASRAVGLLAQFLEWSALVGAEHRADKIDHPDVQFLPHEPRYIERVDRLLVVSRFVEARQ